ncbi:serine hydrolase [Comamonas sp. JC664]|uniref:serine hydrolase n=1 Tax=Comamonas sp. JC664 TaxID=2801917 RepID=UPI00191EC99A|nr:serine hydrolase [Comamonas sp. JC664]MBL0694685.1 class A beta-lactamase-related serine hydrolase [Comamonas sp. JC664]
MPPVRLAAIFALPLLLTAAAPAEPVTQWVARPSEAARIARVESGLPPLRLPGEAPRTLSLQEWMTLYKIPGVSIAVFEKGALVWAKSYGVREAGGAEPVTLETLFQAASISKPVTALAAMHHAEKRKWSLDADINEKLVSWKVPESAYTQEQKVTLRRLLSHSAGTTVHGFAGYAAGAPVPTTRQVLDGEAPANSSPVRVDTVPGTLTRYSGGGTTIVQQMLVDQLQKPFPRIMRDTVLAPLGLKHSTFEQPLPKALESLAAVGTLSDGTSLEGRWHTYPELGAAGLWTTPSDLARIALEVSKASNGKSRRIVSPSMAKQMLTRHSEAFGIGFMRREGKAWFGHGGGNAGYRAFLLAFADSGSGIAVMTNSEEGSRLIDRILVSAGAEYGWKDIEAQDDSPSAMVDLLVRAKGADAAIAWYKSQKAAQPEAANLSPAILNDVAYSLLRAKKLDEALKVFEANVAFYPDDSNAHDSLGEGYAMAGRKKEAIHHYKKSLELNPKNDNAVRQLKGLGADAAPSDAAHGR